MNDLLPENLSSSQGPQEHICLALQLLCTKVLYYFTAVLLGAHVADVLLGTTVVLLGAHVVLPCLGSTVVVLGAHITLPCCQALAHVLLDVLGTLQEVLGANEACFERGPL